MRKKRFAKGRAGFGWLLPPVPVPVPDPEFPHASFPRIFSFAAIHMALCLEQIHGSAVWTSRVGTTPISGWIDARQMTSQCRPSDPWKIITKKKENPKSTVPPRTSKARNVDRASPQFEEAWQIRLFVAPFSLGPPVGDLGARPVPTPAVLGFSVVAQTLAVGGCGNSGQSFYCSFVPFASMGARRRGSKFLTGQYSYGCAIVRCLLALPD
jgi:hypothetical protein